MRSGGPSLLLVSAALAVAGIAAPAAAQIYTNSWGVKIAGGEAVANSVAIRHGLTNTGTVS